MKLVAVAFSLLVLLGITSLSGGPANQRLLAAAPTTSWEVGRSAVGTLPAVPQGVFAREVAALPREVLDAPLASGPEPTNSPEEVEEPVPNIDQLILDLAHDNLPGNARAARRALSVFLRGRRWWEPEREVVVTAATVNAYNMRKVCKEQLGFALSSRDHQQRQLAANILINCSEEPFPPTLSAVLVEALRYDPIDNWTCHANNEADAAKYLINRPTALEESSPLLRSALYSDDGQQRFLAAFILGFGAKAYDAEVVCPLLFEHLRDNEIPGDAKMAVRSLWGMGEAALPYIEAELLNAADEQAADMLARAKRVILYSLERGEASPYRGEIGVGICWDSKMSR